MQAVTLTLDDEAYAVLKREVPQKFGIGAYISVLLKAEGRRKRKEEAAIRAREQRVRLVNREQWEQTGVCVD